MADSKNAAISGVNIYKAGLNLLVFTLTPFIYLSHGLLLIDLRHHCGQNSRTSGYNVTARLISKYDVDDDDRIRTEKIDGK
jgi:hypothetical protein